MQTNRLDDIAADVARVFEYSEERRPQDRAHDYLDERGVTRTARDTAMQAAASDMVRRAYEAGFLDASGGVEELEARCMELAGIASEVYRASARLMAMTGGDVE